MAGVAQDVHVVEVAPGVRRGGERGPGAMLILDCQLRLSIRQRHQVSDPSKFQSRPKRPSDSNKNKAALKGHTTNATERNNRLWWRKTGPPPPLIAESPCRECLPSATVTALTSMIGISLMQRLKPTLCWVIVPTSARSRTRRRLVIGKRVLMLCTEGPNIDVSETLVPFRCRKRKIKSVAPPPFITGADERG